MPLRGKNVTQEFPTWFLGWGLVLDGDSFMVELLSLRLLHTLDHWVVYTGPAVFVFPCGEDFRLLNQSGI